MFKTQDNLYYSNLLFKDVLFREYFNLINCIQISVNFNLFEKLPNFFKGSLSVIKILLKAMFCAKRLKAIQT